MSVTNAAFAERTQEIQQNLTLTATALEHAKQVRARARSSHRRGCNVDS
jgi:hypothetical protein